MTAENLPAGFTPVGEPNQNDWTIVGQFKSGSGRLAIRLEWIDDDHPLVVRQYPYYSELEEKVKANGGELLNWNGFATLELAPAEILQGVTGQVARGWYDEERLVVTFEAKLDAGDKASMDFLRGYGREFCDSLLESLPGARTKMHTYVHDIMLAADLGTLAPPGFELEYGASQGGNGRFSIAKMKSERNELQIRIEREPNTPEAKPAEERRARWAESDSVLSDTGGVLVVWQFARRGMNAMKFEGPWTLTVTLTGAIKGERTNSDAPIDENEAERLVAGIASEAWSRIFGAEQELEPNPEPAAPEETGPSERDMMLLALVEQMDGLLAGIEEPLQEALVQLQVLYRAQKALRAEMRELSALSASVTDEKLKQKIQERITRNTERLQEQGRELARLRDEALALAADTERSVRGLYEGEDFGPLDDAARTRLELITARVQMFGAQVSLVTGDTRGAIRAAEAMRSNFRLRSHSHYIEGMALLQEGRTLDALAVFRNARQTGVGGAGAPFEALERETEIRVLGSLKRLAAETSRAFDRDFETWIAGRAETNQPADQTTFEWLMERFLKRPWYDTIAGVTGAGVAEAGARGEEAGIVADDMAVTQVGLNFIIGLRRDHRLADIRGFKTAELRAAARERWGRDLTDAELTRMRAAIRHAFELPDLQKLADEQAHLERSSFTQPLAAQVGLEDRWAQGAEVLAMGGSIVNGWSVLTQFAPMARISVAGTAKVGAGAAEALKDSVMLGEYFVASRPVSAALQRMNQSQLGRAALRAANGIEEFAEQSLTARVTVMGAEMAVEGGAAYIAQEYAGETGAMLVDVISATGATTPEFYARAFRKMSRDQVEDMARRLAVQASRQRQRADTVSTLVAEVTEGGVDDIAAFRRRVAAADLEPDVAERIAGYADVFGTAEPAVVAQAQRDIERMATRQLRLAEQSESGARAAGRAARSLEPDAPALLGDQPAPAGRDAPVGDPLTESYPGTVDAGNPRQQPVGDPLAEPARSIDTRGTAREPIGDPLAADTPAPRPGTEALEPAPRPGTEVLDPPPVRLGTEVLEPRSGTAGTARGVRADEPIARAREGASIEKPRLALGDPEALTHAGDVALSRRQFDQAAAEYQRILTDLPEHSTRRRAIAEKLEFARAAAADERKILRGAQAAEAPARPPLLVDDTAGQRAVREAIDSEDPARWVSVVDEVGDATASKPRFVKDAAGNNVAVTKTASGMLNHPEGRAEHLASLLSERLGRRSPRTRPLDAADAGELIVTEMMPQGAPLSKMTPDAAQLIARKDELAEDLVFSMLLGDGDRHLGNYWVTTGEQLVPFDYGLADIVRTHPYRNAKDVAEIQPFYQQALAELEELRGLDRPEGKQFDRIRKLEGDLVAYKRQALYHDLSTPLEVPDPGSPTFERFVRNLSEEHLEWGTRSWRGEAERLFWDSVAYEDFEPHIRRIKRQLEAPGALDAIVDQAMSGHPDIEYTRALLKTRLEQLEDVFSRFPRRGPPIPRPRSQAPGRALRESRLRRQIPLRRRRARPAPAPLRSLPAGSRRERAS